MMHLSIEEIEQRLAQFSASAEPGQEKIDLLTALAEQVVIMEPERALSIAEEALTLSRKVGYEQGICYATGLKGYCHFMLSNHETAMPLLQEALQTAEALDFTVGKAMLLSGTAAIHLSLGNYERALSDHLASLKLVEELEEIFDSAVVVGLLP